MVPTQTGLIKTLHVRKATRYNAYARVLCGAPKYNKVRLNILQNPQTGEKRKRAHYITVLLTAWR